MLYPNTRWSGLQACGKLIKGLWLHMLLKTFPTLALYQGARLRVP